MISEKGYLYVIDFGTAKHQGKGDTHPDLANALDLFLDCLATTLPSNSTGENIYTLVCHLFFVSYFIKNLVCNAQTSR